MKADSAIVFTGTEKNNKAKNSKKHYQCQQGHICLERRFFSVF